MTNSKLYGFRINRAIAKLGVIYELAKVFTTSYWLSVAYTTSASQNFHPAHDEARIVTME